MKRRQKARPGELRATFGRFESDSPDCIFSWGGAGAGKRDGALLHYYFSRYEVGLSQPNKGGIRNLTDDLAARGYDLDTLVFSVMKKPTTDTGGVE